MTNPLKILFVTSEMAPLLSTGGLAEVAYALPRALHARGHDIRVAMPCYKSIPEEYRGNQFCMCVADLGAKMAHGAMRASVVPDTDIPLYLVEHQGYFDREQPYGTGGTEYEDNAERFCFFSQAVLHGIPQVGWMPDVIHCHDWHTAPIPAYLRTRYEKKSPWHGVPTVFTVHNLAYQGRYPASHFQHTGLDQELFSPEYVEYHGDMNLMKAGIAFADKLTTVSPRYAKEIQTVEYGAGLDGMLRSRNKDLHGILNGVDYQTWNPEKDPHIETNFSKKDLSGKDQCKAALQQEFGLPESSHPLFGVVSRLVWHKGMDVFAEALEAMLEFDLQVAVLGTGEPGIESRLAAIAEARPEKFALVRAYNAALSHQVQAGSDFFLMPSRYEPCGLSQMYSFAYGTIPVARWTGGLVDTVRDLNPVHRKLHDATGITFIPMTPGAMVRGVREALDLYGADALFREVRKNGMAQDFSWNWSCGAYEDVYQEALDLRAAS